MQRDAVVDHLPIRSDCLETLATLKARGVYLAIVSNIDDDYLDPLVKKHGLDEVLDHWTSSEEARSCKPDVGIYRYALKKAGLGVSETLFVGDSLQHDIAGASAAGMRSARIIEEGVDTPLTSGLEITAQPDYEISELAELLGLVEAQKGEPSRATSHKDSPDVG
jgi:FMN phosphatase YigB (HAD superfamily)